MADIFLKIFNMSVSACWIVLAILLFRIVLKKAPKWLNCVLWGIAGLRLVMPFSLESVFSLVPSAELVPDEIIHSNSSVDVSGAEIFSYVGNNPVWYDLGVSDGSLVFTEFAAPDGSYINPLLIISYIASIIWLVGIAVLLLYTLISFWRLKRKIGTAVLLRDNIYQSEAVATPFVLGIIKPKIYLPFNMSEQDMVHVIAHEQAHIRRGDHWWKPLGFAILTLHWFNPLVWLGYVLLCRDIELACDEKVVKELNNEQRADYSQALLTCSVKRRLIAACPLAFGEVSVKDRVKSVLNYKKPAFWIVIVAVIISIALAVGFLTNPMSISVFNSKYETGRCLFGAVVSAEKETETNDLLINITSEGAVYKTFGDGTTEVLGTLRKTDYTTKELKENIKKQGEHISLGKVKNAYEVSGNNRDYVIFQKSNGMVYLVSFFSNGNVMNVFRLDRLGDCDSIRNLMENESGSVIDTAVSDIDGDGKAENCVLTYGPTMGLYTVAFTATEIGKDEAEYINTFNIPYTGDTEFYESTDGKLKIKCENHIYEKDETEDVFLDIVIENNNIILKKGNETIEYWGEQGITPADSFKKWNAINSAVSEAVIKNRVGKYSIDQSKPEKYPLAESFEAHQVMHSVTAKNDNSHTLTVYALTVYEEYNLESGELVNLGGGASPVEIILEVESETSYKLISYREINKPESIEDYLPEDYREFDDGEIMESLRQKIAFDVEAYYSQYSY